MEIHGKKAGGSMRELVLSLRPIIATLLFLSVSIAPVLAQNKPFTLEYVIATSSPGITTESAYYAEKMGLFKEENLTVNVTWLSGDSLALRAVIGGQADIGWVGTTAAIQAIAQGAKIKIISSPIVKATNVIVAQKNFKTIEDLKGANIAVSSIGAISYHIPRIILKQHNLDPDSANYVALGSPAVRFQALAAKKVDAAMLDIMGAYEGMDRYDFLHILASVAKEIPDLHFISVVASEKTIKEKPEALTRFVRADTRGVRFALKNPRQAAELSSTRLPVSNPNNLVRSFIFLSEQGAYGVEGGLDRAVLAKTIDIMVKIGDLEKPIPVDALMTPQFVNAALK